MTDAVLEGTWEEVRAHDAELAGRRVRLRVLPTPEENSHPRASDRMPTARELLAMPPAERAPYLADAAAIAESIYAADMALPPHERELTAFTVLDGEDILDHD